MCLIPPISFGYSICTLRNNTQAFIRIFLLIYIYGIPDYLIG